MTAFCRQIRRQFVFLTSQGFLQFAETLGTGAEDRNRTGTILSNRRILSPVRLPVPPLRHIYIFNFGHYSLINKMEAAPRFELGVKDLQSSALPLGYAA
jgi:hypothetical protein